MTDPAAHTLPGEKIIALLEDTIKRLEKALAYAREKRYGDAFFHFRATQSDVRMAELRALVEEELLK